LNRAISLSLNTPGAPYPFMIFIAKASALAHTDRRPRQPRFWRTSNPALEEYNHVLSSTCYRSVHDLLPASLLQFFVGEYVCEGDMAL
jgi:hypothetical protein